MEILILMVIVIVHLIVSFLFQTIANNKGHTGYGYFFLVFFFGAIAAAYIASLPDLVLVQRVEQLEKALRQFSKDDKLKEEKGKPKVFAQGNIDVDDQPASIPQKANREGYIVCDKCGQEQRENRSVCFKCGAKFEK